MEDFYGDAMKSLEHQRDVVDNRIRLCEEVFLPILDILEDEDVTVKEAWWSEYSEYVVLMKETKLTRKAFDRIKSVFSDGVSITHEVEDQYVKIRFHDPTNNLFFNISNGAGTCKVEVIEENVLVQARMEKRKTYKVANGCDGLDLVKEGGGGTDGEQVQAIPREEELT